MTDNRNAEQRRITPRDQDYSQWYLDVIDAAGLAEYGPVKGSMIIKPNGYAIWEMVQKELDSQFKRSGVKNAYFPLLIPEKFLHREAKHVEGFSPEVAVVTHAGGKKLDEPLVIRPTSETIIYDAFSNWIHSHRDLPLLINQWANVLRWEMRPRLFLRTTEFLWQEGHTAHATYDDADQRARMMLEIYKNFAQDVMAIPVVIGAKSESERFAGAMHTYSVEAMMQDGKALQFATSHNLGQNFSKAFNVDFSTADNTTEYVWQTSWGISTRAIGGLVMTHGDDKGLVLPPNIAPVQIAVLTVWSNQEARAKVAAKLAEIAAALDKAGLRYEVDDRDLRLGEKHFDWEQKGTPIRLELGPKDADANTAVLVRRDTGDKTTVPLGNLAEPLTQTLSDIQTALFDKALAFQKSRTVKADDWEAFKQAIDNGQFVLTHWSGSAEVEAKIKAETGATIRCIPFDSPAEDGKCVYSGEPSQRRVLFAKAY